MLAQFVTTVMTSFVCKYIKEIQNVSTIQSKWSSDIHYKNVNLKFDLQNDLQNNIIHSCLTLKTSIHTISLQLSKPTVLKGRAHKRPILINLLHIYFVISFIARGCTEHFIRVPEVIVISLLAYYSESHSYFSNFLDKCYIEKSQRNMMTC